MKKLIVLALVVISGCAATLPASSVPMPLASPLVYPTALSDDDGSVGMRWCSSLTAEGQCGHKG